MGLFNTSIDYQGQDLHMLRNKVSFPLHKFFISDNRLNYQYKFRLTGNENKVAYEKIVINERVENGLQVVYIEADKYVDGGSDRKINNFFITVTINNQSTVILIHLHDELDKVWTSPGKISFRKGMAIKFGVLASFKDGLYADLTFYPDIQISKIGNDRVLNLVNSRLEWDSDIAYPEVFPHLIIDKVEITLPRYLRNTTEEIVVKGSVELLEEWGNLKLHRGNINQIDEKVNILFLSDAFNGTTGAREVDFLNIVNQFSSNLTIKTHKA